MELPRVMSIEGTPGALFMSLHTAEGHPGELNLMTTKKYVCLAITEIDG